MKKLAIISAIAFSGLLYNTADAQFGIHIGIHLFPHRIEYAGVPVGEAQAPADQDQTADSYSNDDFYYLPDVGAYYNIAQKLYYYFDGQEWISATYLPGVYHDYDWRYARRFEIRKARPYLQNDYYRNRYQGFDNDLAHNHDHFREGFDFHQNRDAYKTPQRFDNRGFDERFDNNHGNNDQHFDNSRGNGQSFNDHSGNNQIFNNRGDKEQRLDDHNTSGQFNNRNQDSFNKPNNGGQRNNNQGGRQFTSNQNRGNNDGQQARNDQNKGRGDRLASNYKGYDGHNEGKRDRF